MSELKLHPVPQSKLSIVYPMIQERFSEIEMPNGFDMKTLIGIVDTGYENRNIGAYVDDLEKPEHLLVVSVNALEDSGVPYANILLMFSRPNSRHKGTAVVKKMQEVAETYAKVNGAKFLHAASWIYKGARGTDALWKRFGYEPVEVSYIKNIE